MCVYSIIFYRNLWGPSQFGPFSIPKSQALAEILLPTPPPHNFSRGRPGIILMPKASPLPLEWGSHGRSSHGFLASYNIMFIIIFAGKENIYYDIFTVIYLLCMMIVAHFWTQEGLANRFWKASFFSFFVFQFQNWYPSESHCNSSSTANDIWD